MLLVGALVIPFCTRKQAVWDQVYVSAASRLSAGANIFTEGYAYPPAFAWVALPFASMPILLNRFLWYTINVLAMVLIFRGVWRLSGGGKLEGGQPASRKEHTILLLGLACGIYYVLDALTNLQTDLVIVALVTAGCLWLMKGRDLLSGVSLGLAAGLKCTPLLFAPYLIWRRHFRAAGVLVAVALLINVIPDWTHPSPHPKGRLHYWASTHLAPMANEDFEPGKWLAGFEFNQSLAGSVNRWSLVSFTWDGTHYRMLPRQKPPRITTMKKVVLGVSIGLLLLALAVAGRKETTPPAQQPSRTALEFSMLVLLMVLLSPMSSKPHFAVLLLPGCCLARVVVEKRRLVPTLLLGAAIVAGLLSNKDLVGKRVYDWVIWYGSVFWGAVFLYGGCCWALLTHTSNKGQAAEPVEIPQRQAA